MESRPEASPLLAFDDVWEHCITKSFDFVRVMKHGQLEELESLRALTVMRAFLEERIGQADSPQTIATKLEAYAFHINDLKSKSDTYYTEKSEQQLIFYWTSSLSERAEFKRIQGIDLEVSLVMFLYGSVLREAAHKDMKNLLESGGDHVSQSLECINQLRSAAGVFHHVHGLIIEATAEKPPPVHSIPVELVPMMSQCFEETSTAVLTTLHVAASSHFEAASRLLRGHSSLLEIMKEKLRRFVALNSTLEEVRAYRQQATKEAAQGQPGTAVAICQRALILLETCLIVGETDNRWLGIVQHEQKTTQVIEAQFEKERVGVYYQNVATRPPSLPEGKDLVQRIEYTPLKIQSFL